MFGLRANQSVQVRSGEVRLRGGGGKEGLVVLHSCHISQMLLVASSTVSLQRWSFKA